MALALRPSTRSIGMRTAQEPMVEPAWPTPVGWAGARAARAVLS